MASATVTLGGITFQGHEVPEKIPFGGRQRLVKQVLVGGRRVVDAMGPDEGDRRWDGRFRGESALSRAKAVDRMRQAGALVPLTWGGLFYLVVIEEFEADYRRSTDIPYHIACCVVDDGTGGAADGPDLGALVSGDLVAMGDLLGEVADAVADPIGALADAVDAAGALASAPFAVATGLQTLAAGAVTAIDAGFIVADAALAGAAILDPLQPPAYALAGALDATAAALDTVGDLSSLRGLAGRVAVNLATISG